MSYSRRFHWYWVQGCMFGFDWDYEFHTIDICLGIVGFIIIYGQNDWDSYFDDLFTGKER